MGTMNGDTMTFPALTLPTTAPMTDNALKQRAAQKLATTGSRFTSFCRA